MLRGLGHGHWLVNGFSGFVPRYYPALQSGVLDGDASVLDAVRGDGPLLVVVNRDWDPNDNMLQMARTMPNAILHSNTPIGPAYLVSGPSPLHMETTGQPTGVARLEAALNQDRLSALTDGDLSTRWDTGAAQRPGDELRIVLGRTETVTGVEMVLGGVPYDYPRGLRVTAAIDGGPPSVVWEGEVAGRAVRAALDDPQRTSVFVPFLSRVAANQITLTVTKPARERFWSMAELRVFAAGDAPPERRP
jgi:hypothetical protein